jgi:aminoglycoside phosphotransferase (APT) family kinase protein
MSLFDPVEVAQLVAAHFGSPPILVLVQESGDHAVFEGSGAIVKVGGRDDLHAEAWAMERARAAGVPAARLIGLDAAGALPYLIVERSRGVPLWDSALTRANAERAARDAGAYLRRLHEIRLDGFGYADRDHLAATGELRGDRASLDEDIHSELEWSLGYLEAHRGLDAMVIARLRAMYADARPALRTLARGSFMHGDVGRMHVFVDPDDGTVTDFIDWGDVLVGDPVWELAVAHCHMTSPSEGHLGYSGNEGLFPFLLDGYDAGPEMTERIDVLLGFYSALRFAWVARMCLENFDFVPEHLIARLHELTS